MKGTPLDARDGPRPGDRPERGNSPGGRSTPGPESDAGKRFRQGRRGPATIFYPGLLLAGSILTIVIARLAPPARASAADLKFLLPAASSFSNFESKAALESSTC
jgi:hypothetical protein